MEMNGIRQRLSGGLKNTALSGKQKNIEGSRQDTDNSSEFGRTQPVMRFLVVENLDELDQFILSRGFIRSFDVTIDFDKSIFWIRNPERKYEIKLVILIMANENTASVCLSRRVWLKTNEAAIVTLRMKNYNELSAK